MLRTIIYYMFTRIFQFFEVWCMCVYFNYPGKVYSIIPDVFSNNAYLHNQVVLAYYTYPANTQVHIISTRVRVRDFANAMCRGRRTGSPCYVGKVCAR